MKQYFKRKLQNLLGTSDIAAQSKYLNNLSAALCLQYLGTNKESLALNFFPTTRGGISPLGGGFERFKIS